jgi:hypothetical protein
MNFDQFFTTNLDAIKLVRSRIYENDISKESIEKVSLKLKEINLIKDVNTLFFKEFIFLNISKYSIETMQDDFRKFTDKYIDVCVLLKENKEKIELEFVKIRVFIKWFNLEFYNEIDKNDFIHGENYDRFIPIYKSYLFNLSDPYEDVLTQIYRFEHPLFNSFIKSYGIKAIKEKSNHSNNSRAVAEIHTELSDIENTIKELIKEFNLKYTDSKNIINKFNQSLNPLNDFIKWFNEAFKKQ